MTIGSSSNIAFALNEVTIGHKSSSAEERLALILIADQCSGGATIVDLKTLADQICRRSLGRTYTDLELLAQYGLLIISDNHDDQCFVALPIAENHEIQRVRQHINCDWPFIRGPIKDD